MWSLENPMKGEHEHLPDPDLLLVTSCCCRLARSRFVPFPAMKTACEAENGEIPPLDTSAKAIETFSRPFFSPDPNLEKQRREVLGTSPVFIIMSKYKRKMDLDRREMAADLGISHEALLRYLNQPFDKVFADAGIFPLRRSDIVDDFLERHVERPEARATFEAQAAPDNRRDYPLSYVVGPIGSGKTFFSLQYLRDFRNDEGLPSVLIYWQPWLWYKEVDFSGERGPAQLVDRFFERMAWRTGIHYERAWSPEADKLRLHVCLVLDEADNREQEGFFEKRAMVTKFARELEATQFARSLMVVVCGSLVDSTMDIDDAKDAYFFRMKDWSSDDLHRLWQKRMRPSDP